MKTDLSITPLQSGDTQPLAALMAAEPPGYLDFFTPFPFDSASIGRILSEARHDRFWAMRLGGRLAGFFMLRGFDEGYMRPAFGVYIASAFAGNGLSRLALQFALTWARLNGVATMMLKVDPRNVAARRVYGEAGFSFDRICPSSGQEILVKELR